MDVYEELSKIASHDGLCHQLYKNKEELDTVEMQQRFAKQADAIITACTELFEKEKDITLVISQKTKVLLEEAGQSVFVGRNFVLLGY